MYVPGPLERGTLGLTPVFLKTSLVLGNPPDQPISMSTTHLRYYTLKSDTLTPNTLTSDTLSLDTLTADTLTANTLTSDTRLVP